MCTVVGAGKRDVRCIDEPVRLRCNNSGKVLAQTRHLGPRGHRAGRVTEKILRQPRCGQSTPLGSEEKQNLRMPLGRGQGCVRRLVR